MKHVTTVLMIAFGLILAFNSAPANAEMSTEQRIAEWNRINAEEGNPWTAGRTSVSDLSWEEKKRLCGVILPPLPVDRDIPRITAPPGFTYDPSFDWRPLGGTTPSKNQGGCGSCWAFAATGQLESHVRIFDERLEDLSEQQAISCNDYGSGCGGGWAGAAYAVFTDPGAVAETCMPYEASDSPPCIEDQCEVLARISGYSSVSNTVNSIKEAVLTGPVYTTMDVYDNFYDYSSGCYNGPRGDFAGYHAVLIIGWDDAACGGDGAWIIKNSWGQEWGDEGFCYIKYGVCGIGSGTRQIDYIPSTIFVRVDSPAGGEEWDVGQVYPVTWTTSRETPDSVSIVLSIDGGAGYDDTLVTGLAGVSSYDWTVPELPVATARIKVIAYFGGVIGGFDTSDYDFTIKGKPYRYVSPDGGNRFPYSIPAWAAHGIQDAVDAANQGDTVMVAAAVYTDNVIIDDEVYLMGGWDSLFISRDPDAFETIIKISGSPVSFMNTATDGSGIEGFTLKNGTGTSTLLPGSGTYGGGIFSYLSSPVIKGNRIETCGYAGATGFSAGGGIACYGFSPEIENNEIVDCAAQSGGGIYLYQATATVRNNRIEGCAPNAGYTGYKLGGGIYALQTTLTCEGNIIDNNDGYTKGGGIYLEICTASVDGDTVRYNDCNDSGGGIYSKHSACSILHAVILGNTVPSSGGGIFHAAQELTIENSVIALNEAGVFGGGVYADSAWGGIASNTIDRNFAVYGGGNVFIGALVSLDFTGNLVTYGYMYGFQANSLDGITFTYNNLFGNIPGDTYIVTADSTNTGRNPLYADTTALDYHLLVHSGGIDTGDPAVLDPDGSRSDQGAFGGPGAVMAQPHYIAGLAATAADDTTITLTWDQLLPGGLDYYAVYGDTSAGFLPDAANFLGSAPAGSGSFDHHPVTGCWYYRVSAVNLAGYGGGYAAESGDCASGADLVPPSVTVVYPNGGEEIETGDTLYIEWIATDNRWVDSVSIYFSENAGAGYQMIAHGEPNDSIFAWEAPSMLSDSCLVRIVAYDPGALSGEDISDSLFRLMHTTGGKDVTPAFTNVLEQNYPNPFNPVTKIVFTTGTAGDVSLRIYDATGRLVRTILDGRLDPGRHEALWNGRDDRGCPVTSGVYFYRITEGEFARTKKMVLIR